MSPVKPFADPSNLYFITTTAYNHKPVFQRAESKRILLDNLQFLRGVGRLKLYSYVIMPNHIHAILYPTGKWSLADIVRDFKKHTSKQIIHLYQMERNEAVLSSLEDAPKKNRSQVYKVWEDGYDGRNLFSAPFLWLKIEYIHHNPCQEHWKLANCPEDYLWSSARYYLTGEPGLIALDDIREFLV